MTDLIRSTCEEQKNGPCLHRRSFLQSGLAGLLGFCLSEDLKRIARAAEIRSPKKKNCILLWMDGGPSQMDTFDPKPGTANGGEFKAINASLKDLQISEHLPQMAEQMREMTLIRSMVSTEGSHDRARYLVHTGYSPQPTVQHPSLGAMVAEEIGADQSDLPPFVSVNSPSFGPGYLGHENGPFFVSNPMRKVENSETPPSISRSRFTRRLALLDRMERRFAGAHPGSDVKSHHDAYRQAVRFMNAPELSAFDLEEEPASIREAYGQTQFGQGCLLARRLIESGVRFVEVTLRGWDTHQDNFTRTKALCQELDPGFAALIRELKERELWESTLVLWMGEFGRRPTINAQDGRDHYTQGWDVVLGGCGTPEGRVIGKTAGDGSRVVDNPISIPDLFYTVLRLLDIDPDTEFLTPQRRPITLVKEGAKGIGPILGPGA